MKVTDKAFVNVFIRGGYMMAHMQEEGWWRVTDA